MSLFVTKSIEALKAEAGAQNEGMRRVLGRTDLVSLGMGAVIGAGIFVLTGQAAAAHAGPAIVLSMALAGLCRHWPVSATRSSPRPSRSRARPTPTRMRRWASWSPG